HPTIGNTVVFMVTVTNNGPNAATGVAVNDVLQSGYVYVASSITTGTNNPSVETFPTDFFIPEGFSPNGDGINDLYIVRGIENYPHNTFTVFNRWGNKVYGASPYQSTWDGKSTDGVKVGGDDLPVGTYFYILDLGDGSKAFKGSIYLYN